MSKEVVADIAKATKKRHSESENFITKFNKNDLDGNSDETKRITWHSKMEFLLSTVGFAVDLGNVWRFPYICFKNGGGAFLIPYFTMAVFAGVPLFYMELALGQYHQKGCISLWRKVCPVMKGIGYASCLIGSYVFIYYNTVIAWAFYYLFRSFTSELPWAHCNHTWADSNCVDQIYMVAHNQSFSNTSQLPAQQFFEREVLFMNRSTGLTDLGPPHWPIVLCSALVLIIVFFCIWKGIRSSGKAVWVTATFPYIVIAVLMIRGATLPGAWLGISYYLRPTWSRLKDPIVWLEAAVQVFFSLGPGFGVLIALSSYNTFNNKCNRDAFIASTANCLTSFVSGFVVFSVLGYMAHILNKPSVEDVTTPGIGLLFVVYGQALTTLNGSVFFSIIFFMMVITLGLDSVFAGVEGIITAFSDEFPRIIGKHRKLTLLVYLTCIMILSLPTVTYGGIYVITFLETYATGAAMMFVVLMECVTIAWFYGVDRWAADIKKMIQSPPIIYWRICWKFATPALILLMMVMSVVFAPALEYDKYRFPDWSTVLGWMIYLSSVACIPAYAAYRYMIQPGTLRERFRILMQPEPEEEKQRSERIPLGRSVA